MKLNGIVETALYVEDVARSAAFYERLFALRHLSCDDRFCALELPGNAVLLLFKKGATLAALSTPGGTIPPHDASGHIHLAFKISPESLHACERELLESHIAIESRVDWPRGGTSLYFRDPDGHLLELITPGCWEVY